MTDLSQFLLARIAEEEAAAQAGFSNQADPENGWGQEGRAVTPHVGVIHEDVQRDHVVRWNPARVLNECSAKRRIVELGVCTACATEAQPCDHQADTLRLLALPYADHDDYNEEWRP